VLARSLGAVYVPAGPAVVEVVPPRSVVPALDVVAARVVGDEPERGGGDEAVVPVYDLHVAEVGGAVGALAGEVSAPHLRRRVRPRRTRVHHLAAELHHVGVPAQVAEQERRPVPHQRARTHLQPPVAAPWVLHPCTCVHVQPFFQEKIYKIDRGKVKLEELNVLCTFHMRRLMSYCRPL
jgi:hypothetical protein